MVKTEKIVVMATHDPILALMADRRLVVKNGGIVKILHTTPLDRKKLEHLRKIDSVLRRFREAVRCGDSLPDI